MAENNLAPEKLKRKKLIEELSQYGFFSTFSFEEINLLLFCAERKSYAKGVVIFKEGELGKYFCAIKKGRVGIRLETSGRELAQLGPGEVFGEMAVLDNQPRSATAVALSRVDLFIFDGRRLLDDFPNLSVKLLRYLARELSKRLREADLILDRY